MINGQELLFRHGDSPHRGRQIRRTHLKVRCDFCETEWVAIRSSYIKSSCYHKNNPTGKDFCKSCKLEWEVKNRTRRKPQRNPHSSEFHPTKLVKGRQTKSSNGYARVWVSDLNHPRLAKNKRDKNITGGRVYGHILVMEKLIGRYLTPGELVHHLNGEKTDNVPDNLFLCKNSSHHNQIHRKMEKLVFQLIKSGKVIFDRDKEEFVLR